MIIIQSKKGKLALQIKTLFKVDVEEEDACIYPPFVCKLCELKVKKCWAKYKKKMKAACSIELSWQFFHQQDVILVYKARLYQ